MGRKGSKVMPCTRMVRMLFCGLGTLAVLSTAAPAATAPQCAHRDVFVATLAEIYGEAVQSRGTLPNGKAIEVYSSDAGTFSILVVEDNGLACLVASGADWGEPKDKLNLAMDHSRQDGFPGL